ncbi:MAG TPA: hypothetical protein PLN69_04155 [bacterium]|nr:hypothetical protein [bacterium]
MEIGNIHNIGPQKTDELKEAKPVKNQAAGSYSIADRGDSVDVSSKAKLMQNLRSKYDKLPETNTDNLAEKLESGVYSLSAEEIVSSILRGTLFEVI